MISLIHTLLKRRSVTVFDVVYSRWCNSIISGYGLNRVHADSPANIRKGALRNNRDAEAHGLAEAGPVRVPTIFTLRNPLKILKLVIRLYAILVVYLRFAEGVRKEREGYKTVNFSIVSLSKRGIQVATAIWAWLEKPFAIAYRSVARWFADRLKPTEITDLVQVEPRNRSPFFHAPIVRHSHGKGQAMAWHHGVNSYQH